MIVRITPGSGVGVGASLRALGVDADEHVRRLSVRYLPQRGAYHELDGTGWFTLKAVGEGVLGAGGSVWPSGTTWLV